PRRPPASVRFGDDINSLEAAEQRADTLAHQDVVFHEQDANLAHRDALVSAFSPVPADRPSGKVARTSVPRPGWEVIVNRPPRCLTRSSIPNNPMLSPRAARAKTAFTSNPAPSSRTSRSSTLSRLLKIKLMRRALAYLVAL